MNNNTKDIALKQMVEEMGVYFEKFNTPPVASRVLAYLLVTEPPYATFATIQNFLNAGKSSISNALKFLANDGRVDYFTKSGDRIRYYRVNAVLWVEVMQERILAWNSSTKYLTKILEELTGKSYNKLPKDIRYIVDFESFMQKKWREVLREWNATERAIQPDFLLGTSRRTG